MTKTKSRAKVDTNESEGESAESDQSENERNENSDPGGGSSDDDEDDSEEDVSSNEDEDVDQKDGMADMMAKILHQQVEGKIPVLAKRKTTIMKELEKEKSNKDRLKLARKQKREDKGKFLVVPDHSSTDYERQLRKVATRGVVALFNAITKAKREEHENYNQDAKPVAKKSKAAEVGALSRVNFVSLLQKEARQMDVAGKARKDSSLQVLRSGTGEVDKDLSVSVSSLNPSAQLRHRSVNAPSDDDDSGDNDDEGSLSEDKGAKEQKKGWRALQDSFMVERSLALKDWDKDDDAEDEDASESSANDDFGKRPNPNSKIEDPFRELSDKVLRASSFDKRKGGGDKGNRGKKRHLDDSSDEDDGDYQKKYPKKNKKKGAKK